MMPQFKVFSTSITANEGERAVVAKISTSSVDREGDVLVPQGCNSKDYEKNPTVIFDHNYSSLPIARCDSLKRTDAEIIAKMSFTPKPPGHSGDWLPDQIFALYQHGAMSAFSVGFIPIESRPASERDKATYGPDAQRIISKWSLLEISCVSLPCNQEAVAIAVSKGYVSQSSANKIFKSHPHPNNDDDANDDALPEEMAVCKECQKEFPIASLTPIDGDDGYLCDECNALAFAPTPSAPTPVMAEVRLPKKMTFVVDGPAPKRYLFIVGKAETKAPSPDEVGEMVNAATKHAVRRAIAKARGHMYDTE